MTELNNEPAILENDSDTESTVSAGVMFTTILLLIGGLTLSSAMLIHYGFKGTAENGESISGLTRAWEMAKNKPSENKTGEEASLPIPQTPPADSPATTQASEEKPTGFNLKDLFSKEGRPIRWPRLKLSGFGLPSDGEVGFAIINGKHVVEGGMIGDVMLLEILGHGVEVGYKGETKILIVEMTQN